MTNPLITTFWIEIIATGLLACASWYFYPTDDEASYALAIGAATVTFFALETLIWGDCN